MEASLFSVSQYLEYKNDIHSTFHRENGNKMFQDLKIFDSIFNYNLAIAYAQSKENLSLAYGNRSAAFFKVGKYKECLNSINLAREAGYPLNKIKKLDEREQNCQNSIKHQKKDNNKRDISQCISLSYPRNKKIPWMIDNLKFRNSNKNGRGIFSSCDLDAGDFICMEELKINLLNNEDMYICCNNCTKTNMMNLIPCEKTASFMFCSTKCRDEFYQYADLSSGVFDKADFLLKKCEALFDGRENLIKFLKNSTSKESSCNVFDFDFSNSNKSNHWLNIYKCFLSSSSTSWSTANDLFLKKFLSSAMNVYHLEHKDNVFDKDKLTSGDESVTNFKMSKICYSTFHSLVNHSYPPNVQYFIVDNIAVFYVIKPIKANQLLFVDDEEYIPKKFRTAGILKELRINKYSVTEMMETLAKIFKELNSYKNTKKLESIGAYKTVANAYFIFADHMMFPA